MMSEKSEVNFPNSDSGPSVARWLIRAAWAGAATLLTMHVVHTVLILARSWEYSTIRLQRSFVLASGAPLYAEPGQGAILNTIYGPVGPIAFWPATWMDSPSSAVLLGGLIAMAWFFGPATLLLVRAGGSWGWLLGLPLLLAVALDVWPLTYAGFTVHVEAPALGLGLLACWALLERGGRSRHVLVLASVAAVLAVWTKQVMAPLPVAMILYLAWVEGARAATRLAMWLVGVGGVMSAAMIVVFGPLATLWRYLVELPGGHGWRWDEAAQWTGAIRLLAGEAASVWGVVLLAGVAWARRAPTSTSGPFRGVDPRLFGLVALLLVPSAVLGRIKVGGDVNAFSYVLYFLLVGGVGLLVEVAREASPSAGRRMARVGMSSLWGGLLIVLTAVQIPPSTWQWRQPIERDQWPQERALRYAEAHSDIYFPRLTMVHWFARGDIFHQGVGLLDWHLGGIPVDERVLARHLPQPLEGIALQENGFQRDIIFMPAFRAYTELNRDPELPGFVIYRRPR